MDSLIDIRLSPKLEKNYKKKALGLNFETSALKSLCSSVEMMTQIFSNAESGYACGLRALNKNSLTAPQHMFQ